MRERALQPRAVGHEVKTVFVCQWFPPEPVKIPLMIAKSLAARGHDVSVLTGMPNFPDGKLQPGYRAWDCTSGVEDGLVVHRYPLYPDHGASAGKRILNYLSWGVATTLMSWRRFRYADVALVYSSPATAALAPLILGRIFGVPYVLLVQDVWPDSVMASGFLRTRLGAMLGGRPLASFVNATYRWAAAIVVTSPGMIHLLAERGVDEGKLSLIYNSAPDVEQRCPVSRHSSREELGIDDDAFVITYAGTQGGAQGLEAVIHAAKHLKSDDDIQFIIAGAGIRSAALEDEAQRLGCDNVRFLGRVSFDDMPLVYAASDIQLVSLIEDPLFAVTLPSKIQSILAMGSPIIVMAPGDAASVVQAAGAGWTVRPGDAEGLARAIREAKDSGRTNLTDLGAAGREFYQAHMSARIGGDLLDGVLRNAARRPLDADG